MSFQTGRVWNSVQLDPRPEAEPVLVRANPNFWPALYLPAEWAEERRKEFARTWRRVHIAAPLTHLTLGKS